MSEYDEMQNANLTEIANTLNDIATEMRIGNRIAWINAQWQSGRTGDSEVEREIITHMNPRSGQVRSETPGQ